MAVCQTTSASPLRLVGRCVAPFLSSRHALPTPRDVPYHKVKREYNRPWKYRYRLSFLGFERHLCHPTRLYGHLKTCRRNLPQWSSPLCHARSEEHTSELQ